jgi:hypothetical protein
VIEKGKLKTKLHHVIIHGFVEFDDEADDMQKDQRCYISRLTEPEILVNLMFVDPCIIV